MNLRISLTVCWMAETLQLTFLLHYICKREVEFSICIMKTIIKLFSWLCWVSDIPLRRRFGILICLLEVTNQNHGLNFVQCTNDIMLAGSGNMLLSMLNQVSTQLEVLLSLLRHSMTLIIVGAAWSSDNLAKDSNLLILQKHNLIQAIDSLLIYNSLSHILHETKMHGYEPSS
jgi:hypothetical protein